MKAKHETERHVVMFSGSREFDDEVAVLVALRAIAEQGASVVVGDARGLDEIVRRRCAEIGIDHVVYRADWKGEGKAAGVRRNQMMIDSGIARLIAFFGPNGETPGTRHAVDAAKRAGIPVMIFRGHTKTWDLTEAMPLVTAS